MLRISTIPIGVIPAGTRAILFDVYGTLLDGPRHAERQARMVRVGRRYGLACDFDLAGVLDRAIARAHRHSPEPYPEIDIREIWCGIFPDLTEPGRFALEIENAVHPVSPTPWAASLLDQALEQQVPLGVVSNAQAYTRTLLGEHFPDHWPRFRLDLCAFSYEHRIAKPDLRLLKSAVRPLLEQGLQPCDILFIGDSDFHDGQPARQLGLGFLQVPPLPAC